MLPTQPSRVQKKNMTTTPTNTKGHMRQTTRLTIPTTRFTTPTTILTTDDNQITDPPTSEELENRFCEFRDDGKFGFPLPSYCNVFVSCERFRDGSPRAIFQSCGEGKNFDNAVRDCVDKSTYNCLLPEEIIGK